MERFDTIKVSLRENHHRLVLTDKPFVTGYKRERQEAEPMTDERRKASQKSAKRRARQNMQDIVDSNQWSWFITGTLSPDKVADRSDYDAVARSVSQRLKNIGRNHPGMEYIIVPEQHKDGSWHFHGLMTGEGFRMVDSGHKDGKRRSIFNWKEWTLGWSTATRIDDSAKAGNYIGKYVRKENGVPFGKRRFWASRGADKSVKEHALLGTAGRKELQDSSRERAETSRESTISALRDDGVVMTITYGQYRGRKAESQSAPIERLRQA